MYYPLSYVLQCTNIVSQSFIIDRIKFLTDKDIYDPFLLQLVETYGAEADRYLFRCLISTVDFSSGGRNSGGKDGQQLQLMVQEATALVTKPAFASILCYAFEKQEAKVAQSVCVLVAAYPVCLC